MHFKSLNIYSVQFIGSYMHIVAKFFCSLDTKLYKYFIVQPRILPTFYEAIIEYCHYFTVYISI